MEPNVPQVECERQHPACVGDADALYEFQRDNGVEVDVPPDDRDYGLRDYSVRDLSYRFAE